MSFDQSSRGLHEPTLSYYEANAQRFSEDTRNIDMSSLYEPFLSLLPPSSHILDAGCGSGRDSLTFLERGYEVTAFDASKAMVELASRHTGRPVLHMSFDQVQFQECFDGIWASASLLHVPRCAMSEALYRLSRSLQAGGVMYVSLRYGADEKIVEGRLFNDYNEESLKFLLRTCPELRLVELWKTADLRPNRTDNTWLNALLQRQGTPGPCKRSTASR